MIMIGGAYLCILLFFKKELLCSSLKEQFFFFNSCLLQGDHQKPHFKQVTSPLSSLPPH